MKFIQIFVYFFVLSFLFVQCKQTTNQAEQVGVEDIVQETDISAPEEMVWIPGREFTQGAKENDEYALPHEQPAHQVAVDGFFIDAHEVTNAQFKKFVEATNYVTVAERPIDWDEMKKQLPEGTPKPPDDDLQPGSLIFNKEVERVNNMQNIAQWWSWKKGANWRHPEGPESSIEGKDNYPVVHVAYEDAVAYCNWANRRLPTEAEWELAALGKLESSIYTWGNDDTSLCKESNTWQGVFPTKNETEDGFAYIAPAESYPANTIGLYDMAGNVWEWTQDWYHANYYQELASKAVVRNPQGASEAYNPTQPYALERVIKGGSFLCHKSYCASYRISARMAMSIDSGSDHVGFRTVATPEMLRESVAHH